MLGKYAYSGLFNGTNFWTNAQSRKIWYESETGRIGDPSGYVYEGSAESKGLDPTHCDAIPSIDGDIKAQFFP